MKHRWKHTSNKSVCVNCGGEQREARRPEKEEVVGYDYDEDLEIEEDIIMIISTTAVEVVLGGAVISPTKCPKKNVVVKYTPVSSNG